MKKIFVVSVTKGCMHACSYLIVISLDYFVCIQKAVNTYVYGQGTKPHLSSSIFESFLLLLFATQQPLS